jgi:hypothetical protein
LLEVEAVAETILKEALVLASLGSTVEEAY